MRLKALFSCVGLLAGALVAVSSSGALAAPVRHEAESSPSVCTGTIDANWSGFSGAGFCNGTNSTGGYAQFTVTAAAAGSATLGIRFANGTTTARPAGLVVNGVMLTMSLRPEALLDGYDAAAGRQLFKQRVGGRVAASPVAWSGRAFFLRENGETVVIDPRA